nr:MAG TPA: hypothetical protein [Caudoviricetes sp.]
MKRATKTFAVYSGKNWRFNPRPHEEGDMPSDSGVSADTCVSIHALMKRATHGHLIIFRDSLFQSTPS